MYISDSRMQKKQEYNCFYNKKTERSIIFDITYETKILFF